MFSVTIEIERWIDTFYSSKSDAQVEQQMLATAERENLFDTRAQYQQPQQEQRAL